MQSNLLLLIFFLFVFFVSCVSDFQCAGSPHPFFRSCSPLPHLPRMHHFSRKRLSNKKFSTILSIFLPVIIFSRKQSCRNKSLCPPFLAATACLPPRRTPSPTHPRAVRTRRRDIRCLWTTTMTSRACLRPLICPRRSTHPFCVRVTLLISFIAHCHPSSFWVCFMPICCSWCCPRRGYCLLCWFVVHNSISVCFFFFLTAAPLRC